MGNKEMSTIDEEAALEAAVNEFWGAFFSHFDKNGDGYISWEELTFDADLKDYDEVKAALEAFKEADANGDGKVSKDEFIKLLTKECGISCEEIRTAIKEMKENG